MQSKSSLPRVDTPASRASIHEVRRIVIGAGIVVALFGKRAEAQCTGASPTWTTTPDSSSITACVQGAARGDVIHVTAGNGAATWSAPLSLTRGVALMGPGRDALTISGAEPLVTIAPDATAIGSDEIIRVSGFTFDGGDAAVGLLDATGADASASHAFRNLIVDDNRFANMSNVTTESGAIRVFGQVRGVIYENLFDRCNVVAKIVGNDDVTEWASGKFPVTYGTIDNLYFEDNVIRWSKTFTGGDPGWIETGQGGRIVGRYNTWDLTNASQQELWDIHGFQNWPGGQTGTMVVEYYGNTITNVSGYRWVNHRGSWGLFFDNVATGGSGFDIEIDQYAPGDNGGSGCNADVSGLGTANGQVNNTYVFDDTLNGNSTTMTQGPIGDGCGVTENAGYWNENDACTASACAAGVGRGTTPPTGTCAPGTAYWVCSTPTATTSSAIVQSGHLYQCTNANKWTSVYTPFTYPHPLRGGSADGGVPDAGSTDASLDDAAGNDAGTGNGSAKGCGCGVASSRTTAWPLGLGFVIALLARRRRA